MKYLLRFALLITLLIGCADTNNDNLTIKGSIKGLKKGVLYLQKIKDSSLVTLDSLKIEGESNFSFSSTINEPEMYYLYLNKDDGRQYNDRISFFAEPGEIEIKSSLPNFESNVRIVGGINQQKYIEYQKIEKKFNNRNLRLLKEEFEATKQKDESKLAEVKSAFDKLFKQQYLYAINFAITNKDLAVSPYITLSKIPDANTKYLDTIVKSLSPKIMSSMYGKKLTTHLENIYSKENNISSNE